MWIYFLCSYQKFAKGKDLSRYESADLQSIFGQRKKQASDNKECNTTSEVNLSIFLVIWISNDYHVILIILESTKRFN